MTLEFKDGTTLDGEVVTQALCVEIVKSDNYYYLVNKFNLKDNADSELQRVQG